MQVVLRRLDDNYCDPLELRSDSTLGVPGLLERCAPASAGGQCAGQRLSGKPRPAPFCPASAGAAGEPAAAPSPLSWWCGEDALVEALECLPQRVINPPTRPPSPREHMEPVLASAGRRQPARLARAHPAPAGFSPWKTCPLSQAPIWRHGHRRPPGHAAGVRHRRWPGRLAGDARRPHPRGRQARPAGGVDAARRQQPGHLGADAGEVDTFSLLPASCAPPTWRTSAGW